MEDTLPFDLLEDSRELASFGGWSESVYEDFMAVQRGELSREQLYERYAHTQAILSLDLTGYTASSIRVGELESLLRILNAQKVCVPTLKEHGAHLLHCFADDILALFDSADAALDAAFEIHRRVELFNRSSLACGHPAEACIGIGYGRLLDIGPNRVQGEEMNIVSKLGEDIARSREVLVTERAHQALAHRTDVRFMRQNVDDQLFGFFEARPLSD